MQAFIWPYLAGLLVAALIIMIVMNALYASSKRSRESFERARPATARVLQVGSSTTSRSYRGVVMELRIQIHVTGLEPYELDTLWAIDPSVSAKMQVGKTFAVKVDPEDHSKIYAGEGWARSLGVMKNPIKSGGE